MSRRPNDKILDNKYNSGEIDYEIFSSRDFKVNEDYSGTRMLSENDSEKYNRQMSILLEIESILAPTDFNVSNDKKKKVPKSKLSDVFCLIHNTLKGKNYTHIEIIIGTCEYLGCNYASMYEEIPVVHKEKILKELNEDINIMSDLNIKKLF